MKLLAFDTSTEVLSIGVAAGGGVHVHTGAGGAQASFGLIAGVQSLLAQAGLAMAQLDAVVFGAGPGSFTGLRTACAVAQGLALGADLPVLPVNSLLAVAEDARLQHAPNVPEFVVLSLLDARMDEVYAAPWRWDGVDWHAEGEIQLCAPQSVVVPESVQCLAGNVFPVYPGRVESALAGRSLPCVAALPSARALLQLAPGLLHQGQAVPPEQALPLYVRDKVAKTTAEREREKALQVAQRSNHG
ncbi:tRNA (adenosine(37)-N6)-threonylcarbamoyltransferase complex dimerization subunit type 1 TsaB [Curvibacter sp. APW13]|uniref:tRNA (adenosine(37)-N6)-threonylcarbamoyltransferase complex dimerization subunit type 1 TsaB n=1 Tax=Curvibacter sp. APW13 TaxID=3077236 RepID=UPI0028DFDE4B|nr:tRNA (adenosine(37)-N6)-threonylcarbamoyltransferase complex dimerization subunit type 1 TsaB [Curvibacter sp. APW13]MDT8990078.1 tRNA (adenosine(37)-N6)-threonylcarbamoyltransferase complex dimerization subunit type 1 TsaB [Curvibacter sp. APW13]